MADVEQGRGQLDPALQLDEHVGDRPYGVDIVIPGKYEGMGELDPVKLEAELRAMIPDEHRVFVKKILADHGVPELEGGPRRELLGWTADTAAPLVEVILKHEKVKLVANALGTPPDDVIDQVHSHGMLVAALAGSVKHALNHKAAGVDIVICQGSEGGGHTGDVGSIVLWPEVIDAVAPLPVLAAGGIAGYVGEFWLVANAVDRDPPLRAQIAGRPNVRVAEGSHGQGVYEAVVTTLARRRIGGGA